MLQKRQAAIFDRRGDSSSPIATLTRDYPAGHVIASHFHNRDQLVYAIRGVMTVRTGSGAWVVPTYRAVWIPSGVPHSITMSGTVAMRTLYLKPRLARTLPRACTVVNVSALLRELILRGCTFRGLRNTVREERHLIRVILDQLEIIQTVPLQLPTPSEPRALRVAKVLFVDPSERRSLTQICKEAGASRRTLERLFQDNVGMTFGKWRQQLRLMQAMRLLAEGAKVTHAALESGYSTPSAFINMFRKALGTTPRAYFRTNVSAR